MGHKIPDTLAKCADLLYQLREERTIIQRKADEIEVYEKVLKSHLIDNLDKEDSTGVTGRVAHVKVLSEEVPTVKDWDKFYAFIKKGNSFHLLNRAVNKASVKELWDSGKDVPGVDKFNVIKVSITKAK